MITIHIDGDLLDRLDRVVDRGGRSEFIRGAIEARLELEPLFETWNPKPENLVDAVKDMLDNMALEVAGLRRDA